jgi:hypothetical protein
MPDFGSFRGFGEKLMQGQTPTQLGVIGSINVNPKLLDAYPNAAAAYSLRKLTNLYLGNAIRVRRTDNTEQDIGFNVDGDLDTTALTSFCNGTNGFVTTWYDQSGNGRNATQTTATLQPLIVSSGIIYTLNGKTRLSCPSKLFTVTQIPSSSFSIFSVLKNNTINNYSGYYQNVGTGSSGGFKILSQSNAGSWRSMFLYYNGSTEAMLYSRGKSTNSLTGQYIETYIAPGTEAFLYENNTIQTTTSSLSSGWGGANVALGSCGYSLGANGDFDLQEIILYSNNQTSNRLGINNDINSYYAIY